jgi:heme-degrading monooxygenase HmoA
VITHIVLFKLKDRSPGSVERARRVLSGLEGKIPELRGFEVGADVLRSERSYDIALTARFDSLSDLQAYQVHPAHQEVVRYMTAVRESAASVDYDS